MSEKSSLETILPSLKKAFFVPVHPAGWPFIAIAGVIAFVLAMIDGGLGIFGLVLTLAVLYFFRDPVRIVPQGDHLVIAPADGRVSKIDEKIDWPAELDAEISGKATRVSIFLSVLDVHVNRTPVGGTVRETVYYPGKFLNAELDKASEENERCLVLVDTPSEKPVVVTQIAGLIARRIINTLKADDVVEAGGKMGLIRFGSRLDVYMPSTVKPQVMVGQRMVGGETIIADLKAKSKKVEGKAI